jgi:starch synthase
MNEELHRITNEKNRKALPRILMTGAECAPFAKTGGLADVIGTLARELKKLGYDIRLMLPFHRMIKDKYRGQVKHVAAFNVNTGGQPQYAGIELYEWEGIPVYFVDNEHYFGHAIYCGGDFEGDQYAFFSRAVIDALPIIGFEPEIIHVNDWHTAIIPMLLKIQYAMYAQGKSKTILTIHNLGYQGRFNFGYASHLLGIDGKYFHPDYIEFHGDANFLKAGIVFADKLVTVSPTYAQEIRMPYYGEGLDGILRTRSGDLTGILNGIDTDVFNPATDPLILHPYDAEAPDRKQKNKEALIAELGLSIAPEVPLIGMVTRLTRQKGIDLVMHVFDEIIDAGCGFALIGTGEKQYENFFRTVDGRSGNRAAGRIIFDDGLAHRIYAGCDFFLMPSQFEPCGLAQMIALRYGTLPIVRATGGLKDTVCPFNEHNGEGNGFSFDNYNAHDMLHTVRYALGFYRQKTALESIRKRAMKQDWSFKKSTLAYAELYTATAAQAAR